MVLFCSSFGSRSERPRALQLLIIMLIRWCLMCLSFYTGISSLSVCLIYVTSCMTSFTCTVHLILSQGGSQCSFAWKGAESKCTPLMMSCVSQQFLQMNSYNWSGCMYELSSLCCTFDCKLFLCTLGVFLSLCNSEATCLSKEQIGLLWRSRNKNSNKNSNSNLRDRRLAFCVFFVCCCCCCCFLFFVCEVWVHRMAEFSRHFLNLDSNIIWQLAGNRGTG